MDMEEYVFMEYILSGLETINGLLTSVLNFAVFDWELLICVIFSVYFVLRVDIFTFSYKKLIGFCVLMGVSRVLCKSIQ